VKPFDALWIAVPIGVIYLTVSQWRERVSATALVLITAALASAPWVIRNYVLFKAFPPLAAGATGENVRLLTLELDSGEDAYLRDLKPLPSDTTYSTDAREYLASMRDGHELLIQERALITRYGPELARHWPRYLLLSVRRIPRLWVTERIIGEPKWKELFARSLSIVLLLLGLPGMWLRRKCWRKYWPLYSTVVLFTLIYAPYTKEARYTLPARPAMIVFATVCLLHGVSLHNRRKLNA
jgi:hypothetical protein